MIRFLNGRQDTTHHDWFEPNMRSRPTGGHLGGSYPLPPNGLQRKMRHTISVNPLPKPNCWNDSMEYVEHVGRKRQTLGKIGEMKPLYIRTAPTANLHDADTCDETYG